MSIRRPVNYRTLVPEGTFLHDYMKSLEDQETAIAYDFWTGVWLLSSLMGRQVFINRPRAPVYLNWYIILAGESGITRKSSAVVHARKLEKQLMKPTTITVHGKVTPEQLLFKMHERSEKFGECNVSICVSELIGLLGKERYTMALPGLLTDIYDCSDSVTLGGTLSRGEVTIRNNFVTLLGASTPSWLLRAINPDVIEGGFTSRTIFVPSEKPKRLIPWPKDDPDGKENCLETLQTHIGNLRSLGEAERCLAISARGLVAFSDWYKHRSRGTTEYLRSFESREDAHVLRLAGTLAINDRSWIIDASKIRKAVRVIGEVKQLGSLLFSGGTTTARVATAIERIRLRLIEKAHQGEIQSRLFTLTRGYLTKEMFDTVMDIMHELQMVQKFEERGRVGRPSIIWRATKMLTARGSIDTVLEEIRNVGD